MPNQNDGEPVTSVGSGVHPFPVVRPADLGRLLAKRRAAEKLSLEQVARLTGVSAATLWRWERRRVEGDPHRLRAVAAWLGVQFDPAVVPLALPLRDPVQHEPDSGTVEMVEAHLRADRNLDPKTAAVLARMFRAAYEQFAETGHEGGASDG